MRKTINFLNIGRIMVFVSILTIVGGFVYTFLSGGFDLSIDFQAGLNQRIQVAPAAFSVIYNTDAESELNVTNDSLTIKLNVNDDNSLRTYSFSKFPTIGSIADALRGNGNITVKMISDDTLSSKTLIELNHPVKLSESEIFVNYYDEKNAAPIPVGDIRTALGELGSIQIQTVGDLKNNEFIVRVEDTGEKDFHDIMSKKIINLLGTQYGAEKIIVKQSDYVGPRFSKDLAKQSIFIFSITLFLMLVYVWFRFEFAFALGAIIALLHDAMFMMAFIGVFKIEISTATIAAVLTVVGYSINDTIVIFDRIRENMGLLRGEKYKHIVNVSVTQSLSRTIVTSLTTLLAIIAIYIYTTDEVHYFALEVIVGIVVGTYSSIYIASPIMVAIKKASERRSKEKETGVSELSQKKEIEVLEAKAEIVSESASVEESNQDTSESENAQGSAAKHIKKKHKSKKRRR